MNRRPLTRAARALGCGWDWLRHTWGRVSVAGHSLALPAACGVALVGGVALGCDGRRTNAPPPESSAKAQAAGGGLAADRPAEAFPLISQAARAHVFYSGLLIDFGSPAAQGLLGPWSLSNDTNLVDSEHDGATWAKAFGRGIAMHFIQDEAAPLALAIRARGGTARIAAVLLDGKAVGTVRLLRGQIRTTTMHLATGPVAPGLHVLGLRFAPVSRSQSEPYAEIDWVRVGAAEEETATYAAPTLKALVVDTALGAVPHRSIGLRGGAAAGFSVFVPPQARLRTAVGFEGTGTATAELAVVQDGEPAVTLERVPLGGGDQAGWKSIDAPLDAFSGKLVTLRLVARDAPSGGRLLFGDPAIVVPNPPVATRPEARVAVVVVLSGVDRQRLLSPNHATISELDRTTTSFERHRAPTTVSSGVLASLLTGLPPRSHTVEDPAARLPGEGTTISIAARDGSVQTAMFTGCPTTFAAFGFARGWDKYSAYSPVEGAAAVAPITDASQWLATHMKLPDARALVVIHARGGHPPWDVTPLEASRLPPLDYSGTMEPRRSAQILERARGKRARYRLTESDRTRMWAIYEQALIGHDRALGGLVDTLRRARLWDQTLFVLTGDTGLVGDSKAPFGDAEDLTEAALSVPLWIHFPGDPPGGRRVSAPTEVVDIAKTVLNALRLGTPADFQGRDLWGVASGAVDASGSLQWATLGPRFATRLGDLILTGTPGKSPSLCDLAADPTCETDRAEKMPRAALALWRATYDAEQTAQKLRKRSREPATVDPETAAALQVWGE